jgi:hypothetical protein
LAQFFPVLLFPETRPAATSTLLPTDVEKLPGIAGRSGGQLLIRDPIAVRDHFGHMPGTSWNLVFLTPQSLDSHH